jgi:outer membrane translocation and assembly module TamA
MVKEVSFIMLPSEVLLSSSLATLRSGFRSLLDLTLHLPLLQERERYYISLINFITTTSGSVLYSALSVTLIQCRVSEKQGLRLDGLLQKEKVGMRPYAMPI